MLSIIENDIGIWIAIGIIVVALWQLWQFRQFRNKQADIQAVQTELAETREKLAAMTVQAEQSETLREQLDEARSDYQKEMTGRVEAQQELKTLQDQHDARLQEIRGMRKELEDRFENLASGVLKTNSDTFLNLVSERFKTHKVSADEDLEQRKVAIEGLVKPLSDKLGDFGKHVAEIEKQRGDAYAQIQEQIKQLTVGHTELGQETRKLVQALRAPKTRGRWGEMQLRQVFEMAGMAENVDYELERHINTDSGALRPDAIVHIPGGKNIVIDAKTPLEGYLDALESETPDQQQTHMLRHAKQIKEHVKTLSSKAYQDALPTAPDFVVMFIPGETFVAAAVEADSDLIEFAFGRKVLIATPTTLMALVKAIAYGWQQEKMAENAVEVQKTAKELYDRLNTFGGHLDSVGKGLKRSVEAYNKAVGSMESRVLPSARKFEAMGVVTSGKEIESPGMVESEPRVVSALVDAEKSQSPE